jgi:glucose-6-phosphate 1-epimerase
MNIEQLNVDYGLADQLQFMLGKGRFPVIAIHNPHAQALISVYGGQVLSFQPTHAAEDLMFISQQAYYEAGKAIRGGTPICWPWFGSDPEEQGRPNHGFARDRLWQVKATETTPQKATKVKLELISTAETQGIWPYGFNLSIDITVDKTLNIELITYNTGDQPFALTQALHTYFKIGEIEQIKIHGLAERTYIDKVNGGIPKQQSGTMAFSTEVDRIYKNTPSTLRIEDPTLHRNIEIQATGSQTTIVWNPWAEKSAMFADLADGDYKNFVCVETANVANDAKNLQPGTKAHLSALYSIEQC